MSIRIKWRSKIEINIVLLKGFLKPSKEKRSLDLGRVVVYLTFHLAPPWSWGFGAAWLQCTDIRLALEVMLGEDC